MEKDPQQIEQEETLEDAKNNGEKTEQERDVELIKQVFETDNTDQEEMIEEESTYKEVLEKKITQLEEDNDSLIAKLDELEKAHKELTEKMEELEREKNDLAEKNERLEEEKQQLEEQIKPSKEYDNEVLESLIFPINTIDQIAAAYRNTGENELVAEQLEKVAELTIQQIRSLGVEEIPVYGKEMDGEYMESFGTASHVKDESLPPHAVAIVSRRAFKRKDSDEIIQNALVYTVPEEGN